LWQQLVLARSGGTPFCALGGHADCTAVWNSAFATAVHTQTGLPIAAWGVVWALAALVLPLTALLRAAGQAVSGECISGTRLVAAAGLITVFAMAGLSLAEGALCLGCVITYALVLAYAGIALYGWRDQGLPDVRRGLGWAVVLTLCGYALLLYPGSRTPRAGDDAGRAAVAAALGADNPASAPAPGDPDTTSAPPSSAPARPRPDGPNDRKLYTFVEGLAPEMKQALSSALKYYRDGPVHPLPAPRLLQGEPSAPVRITEFTDVLCPHCADLHETLALLRQQLPAGSFSVEPRQFPLDAECNFSIQGGGRPVRCAAAKALVCLEGTPGVETYTGLLFARQAQLDVRAVFDLAGPYASPSTLQRCIADPATQAKLDADIALAQRYDIRGRTPLVLVNGRRGLGLAPFLYAMVLTGGSADHAAFDNLPAPQPIP
jgi:serine/threonine-protein kinase